MIKQIRSKLSVKVFLITSLLMALCCTITYLCIIRFAPYIYSHELSEMEELPYEISKELSHCFMEEGWFFIQDVSNVLASLSEDEFVFHIFEGDGKEVSLPYLDTFTGDRIENYENVDTSERYHFRFVDGTEDYTVLIAKNTNKESQITQALQKTVPILGVVIFAVSVIAAFFYTWYMTRPIKKISKVSKRMADMDFSGRFPTRRIDEIGVLSDSLNHLSSSLVTALSELQDANQKLQADIDKERQLDRQRLEFFSAASHELKTPITIIKGQLHGMLCGVGRYKDRETYLAESLAVTNTLEEMVQELLTVYRLETPGYACNRSDVDFERLVLDRLTAHEDLFAQNEVSIQPSLTPMIFLHGDVQLLQRVIDNLLCNAAIYSPAGSDIFFKLYQEQGRVYFSVENTGVHIPEETIPKLFEAFYRVEQSRNRETGGSGLGLYIVKTILDLHGANMQIANTNRGVIATIQF